MSGHLKLLTGASVVLLLGLGLCGMDFLIPSSRHQEFGGWASYLGFAICLLSMFLLLGTLLSLALTGIIGFFKKKK